MSDQVCRLVGGFPVTGTRGQVADTEMAFFRVAVPAGLVLETRASLP